MQSISPLTKSANSYISPSTNHLEQLQNRIPTVSDKALINLVNGIQVNKDIIRYRKNRGFFGKLFDKLDGSDGKRKILLDGNIIAGQEALHNWVLELTDSLNISQVALEVTQKSLLEARNAIRNQKQSLQAQEDKLNQLVEQINTRINNNASIFDPEPIEYFLKQAVHPNTLRQNIELWVTVFPSLKIPGLGYDLLIDLIRAKMGATACWLCLQDCRDDETIYNLLLASAALPLAFPSREVNGINYIDGGLVENVRLKALAKRGCKNVIVIHLKNGSVWNRNDFPEQTIIEIRPEKAINKSEVPVVGVMDSWLDFSTQRITKLKQQGYEDAKRCLNPIIDSLISVREYRQSQASLVNSTQQLVNDAPL